MHHPLLFQAAIAFGMLAMAAAGFLLFVVVPILTIVITVVLTKRRMTRTQTSMTFVLWLKHIAIGLGCSFAILVAKYMFDETEYYSVMLVLGYPDGVCTIR